MAVTTGSPSSFSGLLVVVAATRFVRTGQLLDVTWGKSTILSVDAYNFKFEYTLNSAKHIPFDWVGP